MVALHVAEQKEPDAPLGPGGEGTRTRADEIEAPMKSRMPRPVTRDVNRDKHLLRPPSTMAGQHGTHSGSGRLVLVGICL